MINELHFDRPVLALFPNFIGFGYALFNDENAALYCGMVSIRIRNTDSFIERVERMIKIYNPPIIVLPTATGKFNHKRERIQGLLAVISILADKYGIIVKVYSREQIRMAFQQHQADTKQKIAEKISECLPEYKHRCPQRKKNSFTENYNQGMFDAMSLAYTHFYMN